LQLVGKSADGFRRESRTERVPTAFPVYPRVLKDIPRFAAITTLVAPGERFNALAIFLTPRLSRAIVFNVRMASFDHALRTTFFVTAQVLGWGQANRRDWIRAAGS
jgi:hypothetical protein